MPAGAFVIKLKKLFMSRFQQADFPRFQLDGLICDLDPDRPAVQQYELPAVLATGPKGAVSRIGDASGIGFLELLRL